MTITTNFHMTNCRVYWFDNVESMIPQGENLEIIYDKGKKAILDMKSIMYINTKKKNKVKSFIRRIRLGVKPWDDL